MSSTEGVEVPTSRVSLGAAVRATGGQARARVVEVAFEGGRFFCSDPTVFSPHVAQSRREPMFIADGVTYNTDYFSIPGQYRVSRQARAGTGATPEHKPDPLDIFFRGWLISRARATPLHDSRRAPPPISPGNAQPFVESILLPHGMVFDRVEKMASDIRTDFPTTTPHLLVVLKGGSEFAVDLTRTLRKLHAYRESSHLPFTVDYVRVKSYEGTESTGTGACPGGPGWCAPGVPMCAGPSLLTRASSPSLPPSSSSFLPAVKITGIDMKTVRGRDLIIVEDIIDTGTTMSKLIPALEEYGPKSVRVAALLEKRTPKSCGFKADYVGFSVPDAFVVGAFSFCCCVWGVGTSPPPLAKAEARQSADRHLLILLAFLTFPVSLTPSPPTPTMCRLQPRLQRGLPGAAAHLRHQRGGDLALQEPPRPRGPPLRVLGAAGGEEEEGGEGGGRGGRAWAHALAQETSSSVLACATAQFPALSFSPAAPAQRAALPPPQSRGSHTRLLHLSAHSAQVRRAPRCGHRGRQTPAPDSAPYRFWAPPIHAPESVRVSAP
jgi:hypoxanthine phosphoribosyltransferase